MGDRPFFINDDGKLLYSSLLKGTLSFFHPHHHNSIPLILIISYLIRLKKHQPKMQRFLFLLPVLFSACQISSNTEVSRWEEHAANTTIIRDDFGVPHVYGKTDANAVFGLLYAQCEDDFKRVEQNYIWATGRLAEVDGEEALYSDLRARLFMTRDEAIANYEKAQQILMDDAVAIFYADIMTRIARASDIQGLESNPAYNAVFFHRISR